MIGNGRIILKLSFAVFLTTELGHLGISFGTTCRQYDWFNIQHPQPWQKWPFFSQLSSNIRQWRHEDLARVRSALGRQTAFDDDFDPLGAPVLGW